MTELLADDHNADAEVKGDMTTLTGDQMKQTILWV